MRLERLIKEYSQFTLSNGVLAFAKLVLIIFMKIAFFLKCRFESFKSNWRLSLAGFYFGVVQSSYAFFKNNIPQVH